MARDYCGIESGHTPLVIDDAEPAAFPHSAQRAGEVAPGGQLGRRQLTDPERFTSLYSIGQILTDSPARGPVIVALGDSITQGRAARRDRAAGLAAARAGAHSKRHGTRRPPSSLVRANRAVRLDSCSLPAPERRDTTGRRPRAAPPETHSPGRFGGPRRTPHQYPPQGQADQPPRKVPGRAGPPGWPDGRVLM